MYYSFSTVLMAILTSNILLILVHLLFANGKLMITVGYKVIGLIVILTLVRLFIPFEFPFAQNVFLEGTLSDISGFIQHPFFIFHGINISPWFFFCIVWIIGVIILFMQYIKQYHQTKGIISVLGHDVTEEDKYSNILNQLYPAAYANKFQLVEIKDLPSPMIFSFFHPCILLPAGNTYTSKELTFILGHEISHYRHGDLHLKFLVQLLIIIYWWNPFSFLISKHLNAVLEMHVDDSLTKGDPKLIESYLSCLLKLKQEAADQPQQMIPDTITLSINDASKSLLEKRFNLLTHKATSFNKLARILFISASIVFYFYSYCYVLEPYELATEYNGEPVFTLTDENAYIIAQEDGTYRIYWNNMYIETVDSLDYYDSSIPIYYSEEELYED